MKKKWTNFPFDKGKKIFLIMRITMFIMLVNLMQVTASVYSQTTKVALNLENASVDQVLEQIEDQSEFNFLYRSDLFQDLEDVDVKIEGSTVEEILDELIVPHGFTYEIDDKTVIIRKKEVLTPPVVPVQQQKGTVSGKVTDTNGEPIPGVSILVKGTTTGIITDFDGNYTLSGVADDAVLVFSFVGMRTQEIQVAGKATFNVVMEEDAIGLEEIVAVGYGVQKKENLTGAVDFVSSESVGNKAVANASQALQGVVPNMNITFNNGRPDAEANINIRGNTSINGGEPLVLIDGVPGNINKISPKDIQSISVLKDAASASIYGARGAFGVILVTTKEAKDGDITVQYSNNFGWSSPTINTDNFMTDGYLWSKINDEARMIQQGNSYTGYTEADYEYFLQRREDPTLPDVLIDNRGGKDMYIHYGNTDWWHEFFSDIQPSMEHNVSLSGGTEKLNVYLSARYYKKNGIYKISPDIFDSYTIRNRINIKPVEWLRVSNTINVYTDTYRYPSTSRGRDQWTRYGNHANPALHPTNPDGSIMNFSGLNAYEIGGGTYADLTHAKSNGEDNDCELTNTTAVTLDINDKLTLNADFTYKRFNPSNWERRIPTPYTNQPDGDGIMYKGTDVYMETISKNIYKVFDAYANYSNVIGNHSFEGLVGFNQEVKTYKKNEMERDNLLSESLNAFDLATGENIVLKGSASEWAVRGVFYRVKYDYESKYLVEFNGRYDLTSRFPKDSRAGFFPSVSAAWRVSEEGFFSGLKKSIDNLKLRASYGTLGNQDVDTYAYISSMERKQSKYIVDDLQMDYLNAPAVVASDLTWEVASTIDFGFDMTAFNSRFNVSYDWYNRQTKNMLTKGKTLPSVFGADEPEENAADLETKGFELKIGWHDQFTLAQKPFKYNFSFLLSDYTSKITKYDNPNKYLGDYYEGQTLGEVWGYSVDGFFQTDDEYLSHADQRLVNTRIVKSPVGHPMAGDVKFIDLNEDGVVDYGDYTVDNPGDMKVIGNTQPRYAFGFEMGAEYGGFDLSVFFQGIAKQNWWPGSNNGTFWGPWSRTYHSFIPEDIMEDSWTPENRDAYLPRLFGFAAHDASKGYTGSQLGVRSDKYLQDVGYVRLKNIVLGYTIPDNISKKIKLKSVRLFCNATNLFTFSKLYRHNSRTVDPEQLGNGNAYPFTKTISAGVDIKF